MFRIASASVGRVTLPFTKQLTSAERGAMLQFIFSSSLTLFL
jgi:hypothetical protein